MLTKLLILISLSVHFVSQCGGFQDLSHLMTICGDEKKSSVSDISKLSENSSAFQKNYDNHNQISLLPSRKTSKQLIEQSTEANFKQFVVEEDLFPRNWDNSFYFPETLIRREDQPVKLCQRSSLSLAHLSHEDSKFSQFKRSHQFYESEYLSPFDFSSFFNIEHHAEIYPQTLSTETKTVLTRNSQPSSSRNLNDVNIKNLETHFANLWDPHSLSADPTQDSLEMHQIDQSKEDFPSRSTQSNMSDRWKIVLNYNEDDQKLLEEMLDFQDGQNLLEEMLSSQDNQEVVTFKLPTSSQSSIFLRKPHGKDTPMAFRTLTLESSKYDGKIDNLKNLENKKRKISSIYKTEKPKTPKLELKKQTVKQERKKLVDILINNFTIGPKKMEQPDEVNTTAIKNSLLAKKKLEEESKYQRSLDIKILNFLEKVDCEEEILNFRDVNSSSSGAFDSVPNAVSKRAQIRTFEYIQRIQWKGSESFKKEISDLVGEFQDLKRANPPKAIPGRIRDISTVGVTLMKIISKFYSTNPRSEEYGNNQYILNYTKEFWKIYFLDKENMDQELEIFCRSIGAKSESEIDKCISIRFTSRKQGLSKIISEMRKHILLRVDKNKLLQYAWYFALIRASVFFPEDILIPDSSEVRLNYRKFFSYGIMYFVLKYG